MNAEKWLSVEVVGHHRIYTQHSGSDQVCGHEM